MPVYQEGQLEIRNLENTQGIEADLILISIGYGKNEKEELRLNFGPVNQVNGANRLNVLFTRAREKMVVFTSIKSSDFPLSSNRGVTVLHDFLAHIERLSTKSDEKSFPDKAHEWVGQLLINRPNVQFYSAKNGIAINCFVDTVKSHILLIDPCLNENEVSDLETIVGRLRKDYRKVKIVLSIDIWMHTNRVREEIIAYF